MRTLYSFLHSLAILLIIAACQSDITIVGHSDETPRLMPDYAGVTIPCNISPLSFSVEGIDEAALIVRGTTDSICLTTTDGSFSIPHDEWQSLLAREKGRKLTMTICRPTDGGWIAMRPTTITVSPDSIDPYVVYRRIQPGYGLWNSMGIYQRNLANFDETAIYENREGGGNCINCHSFNQGNPDQWQVHIRRNHAGTYVMDHGKVRKLDPQPATKLVYPSWHPSGRYIAYSSNNTFFHIHTADPNRWEVMDDGSDVFVVDTNGDRVMSAPELQRSDRYETFPCFSPDGRWLYYCSATAVDTLTRQYDKVQYHIWRIAFDGDKGTFGQAEAVTDTLSGMSEYMPRISPDGRYLCYVSSAYGNFGVCHRDADLWMLDLKTGEKVTVDGVNGMAPANSPFADSWHSWSSNSRWLVFSSKRDDAMYTRLYFTHVSPDGRCTKAFELPQRDAHNYYDLQMDGYSIPELVRGEVRRE